MSVNKLTTQGYFIKRLKDSGYVVYKIFDEYPEHDPRKWTILIDPKGSSVYCTCYENMYEYGVSYLEFHDGGQFIPYKYKLATDSFEVVVEHLNKYWVLQKHPEYNKN
jgi:hypothetical protein